MPRAPRRVRAVAAFAASAPASWPESFRRLLQRWLSVSAAPAWATLLERAGHGHVAEAHDLLAALVRAGWVELEEVFRDGVWQPHRLRWTDRDAAREALGLPRRDVREQAHAALLAWHPADPRLTEAVAALAAFTPATALRRGRWLQGLDRWLAEGREGRLREFALFVAGDTKALSAGDQAWLEGVVDFEACGLMAHRAHLLLRARLGLLLPGGQLDLGAAPEALAVGEATLMAAVAATAPPRIWWVVENRSRFDRLVDERPPEEGLIWLPGHAPAWWLRAVGRLLALAPAPGWLHADPDPAGIAIALRGAQPWGQRGLPWQAVGMSADALHALPQTRPLSEADLALLDHLPPDLPPPLDGLADALRATGRKGEQEGFGVSVAEFEAHQPGHDQRQ